MRADFWKEEDCLNIEQAYRTLHEVAGVGHGEIAENHIIVNREKNRVAILDFQGADTFSSIRQPKRTKRMVEWDEGCLEEVLYPWRDRPREF
ncbi:hypothetical protein V866_005288 [Kwoniella sp. B9012]